ncbi:SAG-related sequence SRS60A [Besnoitia besnoiti]|uniref:SAG-related sequence SRS60A n=1 Tax=Besnoitia besnoiti TaxID=94643 RepID=A0A2A9MEE3_BESBE|nr:SAG-related sequence SRS60A [Besnoitia besnoiti]PFH33750.1 SAG-related sequence SRS60A [Besnoitia besnoiti]
MAILGDTMRHLAGLSVFVAAFSVYRAYTDSDAASGLKSDGVPVCSEGKEVGLTLSFDRPAAAFSCDKSLRQIIPPLPPDIGTPGKFFEGFADEEGIMAARFPSPNFAIFRGTKNGEYILEAGSLPPVGGTWYLFCVPTDSDQGAGPVTATKRCRVAVNIKGTAPIHQQCTTVGGTVHLRIHAAGYAVTFGCGYNFPNLDPPLPSTEVYLGRDCAVKQKLTAVVADAEVAETPTEQLYTLMVPYLPPSDQLLCYKCANGSKAQCTAFIEVPGSPVPITTSTTTCSTTSGAPPVPLQPFLYFVVAALAFI